MQPPRSLSTEKQQKNRRSESDQTRNDGEVVVFPGVTHEETGTEGTDGESDGVWEEVRTGDGRGGEFDGGEPEGKVVEL